MSLQHTAQSAYDNPVQFEPLVPRNAQAELGPRTRAVIEASLRLQGLPAATKTGLKELVREMNSYYSNLIEGQGTHPANIANALRHDFSAKPDIAQRQRIAVAHIEAERELETRGVPGHLVLTGSFLQEAHKALYARLAKQDRLLSDGSEVAPGELRQVAVTVGQHQPPTPASVGAFLARADSVYGRELSKDSLLFTAAAAHHRFAWVHPFADGNGRACRLQTHCALLPLSDGLWSVNRGLARQRARYYELLANADMPRHGDLDGRGNLSEKMLLAWCDFFVELCEDQVAFMTRMLDYDDMKQRIAALMHFRGATHKGSGYRKELVLPLHHLFMAGPISRAEFTQMSGLGERTARTSISALLADGLLTSPNHRGPLTLAFPLDALSFLFPKLYPEAESPRENE